MTTQFIPEDIGVLVVKVGTTLLSNEAGFEGGLLEEIVKDLAALKRDPKMHIVIVSSGAMGCGMDLLGIKERPRALPLRQATAAVGQSQLMHYYQVLFQTYGNGLNAAQVLLTRRDLDDRAAYLNIRNTLHTLFEFGNVIPIINENDSTATEEIALGDNDTLAAKIASKLGAGLLILLSDVDGLYDRNPDGDTGARLVPQVDAVTPEIERWAQDSISETSIGGMRTKLVAARIAGAAGVPMVIANGHRPHIILDVLKGGGPCTRFGTAEKSLSHRKRWIAFGRAARGALTIDDGAREAVLTRGTSLLPAGITGVLGPFDVGDAVVVEDRNGLGVAQGIVNYCSADIDSIKGCRSDEIQGVLGRRDFDEVIHRDNLVVIAPE